MFATLYARLESLLSSLLPYYYLRHAIIALAISVAFVHVPHAWALLGAMFYVGREVRDREKLGMWDWPGLVAPVAISIILYVFAYYGGWGAK